MFNPSRDQVRSFFIETWRKHRAREVLTPTRRYEIAASRAHRELFPSSLHQQQVYWTTVGIPAGRQKSLFDEYGNVEAFKGAPISDKLLRDPARSGAARRLRYNADRIAVSEIQNARMEAEAQAFAADRACGRIQRRRPRVERAQRAEQAAVGQFATVADPHSAIAARLGTAARA